MKTGIEIFNERLEEEKNVMRQQFGKEPKPMMYSREKYFSACHDFFVILLTVAETLHSAGLLSNGEYVVCRNRIFDELNAV